MAATAIKPKNTVESLREIVQDLLVPELKALKVSLESNKAEAKLQNESLRNEVRGQNESLRNEVRAQIEGVRAEIDGLRIEIRLRDEKQSQAIQALSDKIGYALDIRERLAVLEDRANRPTQ